MIITQIKKIGKGARYFLEVDENFVGVFEADILARYNLKTGQEIDEEFLKNLQRENGDFACFDRALNLLGHGMKTQKQVSDYLLNKGYPGVCVEKAIKKLEEYGYLDDQVFANEYVKLYGQKDGEKKLRFALKQKGVDDERITFALEEFLDEEAQKQSCYQLAKKKIKNIQLDNKNKQKLFAYLAGRGYTFDVIRWAVAHLEEEK